MVTMTIRCRTRAAALCLALFSILCCFPAFAADSLNWNTNRNRVSADIKSQDLLPLLEQIAATTGWRVLVEPETLHTVSTKFNELPPGEALRMLLGDVNFALVPGTNSTSRLFVFRSARDRATQIVRPTKRREPHPEPK